MLEDEMFFLSSEYSREYLRVLILLLLITHDNLSSAARDRSFKSGEYLFPLPHRLHVLVKPNAAPISLICSRLKPYSPTPARAESLTQGSVPSIT